MNAVFFLAPVSVTIFWHKPAGRISCFMILLFKAVLAISAGFVLLAL
jgi:hypothetical protein